MSKLTLTEAVKLIPVSESTLRRDIKSGKVSFETEEKGRKRFDAAELRRVYGQLKETEPVNDTHQKPSMKGNDTKVIALLEGQVQDLKAQLAEATTETLSSPRIDPPTIPAVRANCLCLSLVLVFLWFHRYGRLVIAAQVSFRSLRFGDLRAMACYGAEPSTSQPQASPGPTSPRRCVPYTPPLAIPSRCLRYSLPRASTQSTPKCAFFNIRHPLHLSRRIQSPSQFCDASAIRKIR